MPNSHSSLNPELSVGKPVAFKDVTITTVDLKPGGVSHILDGVHTVGLSPNFATITPAATASDIVKDVQWQPNSVGYLPTGVAVTAEVLTPARSTFVTLPDRIFQQAAFESIDTSKLEYRWMPDLNDMVTNGLISSMETFARTAHAQDFPLVGEAIGTALAVRMLQQLGAQPRRADTPYPGGLPPEKVKMVVDYIEANIAKPMRLEELAGVVTLSTFHFSRAFRTAMNIAPVRYIWQRRVERAKDLLRSTREPLAMISYACGFSSQSHFTTSFKQATGVTPAAFRANLLATLTALAAGAAALYHWICKHAHDHAEHVHPEWLGC